MTREKLKSLLAEYGSLAIVTWFVIWGLTLAGFALAFSAGVDVMGVSSGAGVFGAAYVATQLTKPLRIAGTLALTPIVAAVLRKLRGNKQTGAQPPAAG